MDKVQKRSYSEGTSPVVYNTELFLTEVELANAA
jgi:hypothetical protein